MYSLTKRRTSAYQQWYACHRLKSTALEDAIKVRRTASLVRLTANDAIPTHRLMKICDVLI